MPLLLYCVADASVPLNSASGVTGSAVERIEECALSIFYSENSSSDRWLKAPLRDSAREFHRVQQAVFRSGAIIPFRFPTILDDQGKVRDHLREHAARYNEVLHRFSNFAQMDIALTQRASPQAASSGSEYLRARQSRARALEELAGQFKCTAGALAADWRQRSVSDGLRCFALLARESVEEFNEKMKTVPLPPDTNARISGPWPVAAFLDLEA